MTRELFASDPVIASPSTLWKRGKKRTSIIPATPPPKRRHASFETGALVQEITIHYTMSRRGGGGRGGDTRTGKKYQPHKNTTENHLNRPLCDEEHESDKSIVATPSKPTATQRFPVPVADEEDTKEVVVAPDEVEAIDLTISPSTPTVGDAAKTTSNSIGIKPVTVVVPMTTNETAVLQGDAAPNRTAFNSTTIKPVATTAATILGKSSINMSTTTKTPTGKLGGAAVDQHVIGAAKGTKSRRDSLTDTTCSIINSSSSSSSSSVTYINILPEEDSGTPTQHSAVNTKTPATVKAISPVGAPVLVKPKSRSNSVTDTTCSFSSSDSSDNSVEGDNAMDEATLVIDTDPPSKACPQKPKDSIIFSKENNKNHRVGIVDDNPTMAETAIATDTTTVSKDITMNAADTTFPSKVCLQEPKGDSPNASHQAKAENRHVRVVKDSPITTGDETNTVTTDTTPRSSMNTHQQVPKSSTNPSKAKAKNNRVGGGICVTPRRYILLLGGLRGKKKRKNKTNK